MNPPLFAETPAVWRAWLETHHQSEQEVWLVFYKKSANKQSTTYAEAVEEALCFGWIDGMKKGLDEERLMHRFTPRKAKSKWTQTNIDLAERLIAQGKMAPAGLQAFERRLHYQ
jgi:uncharacterized protein YdeI (YjbR/CyaY-like superfamily)